MIFAKKGVFGGSCAQIIVFPKEYQGFWASRNRKIGQKRWIYRNFMKFGEISWNFMISAEISWFLRFSQFLAFWSVLGRPGRLKNLNNPIGILRFPACGGQGTTRILRKLNFASFCRFSRNFARNDENLVILVKIMKFYDFLGLWGSKPLKPWFWARNTKVSWRVAESRKSLNFMKFHDFHEIFIFSLIFLIFNEFHWIYKKSTV